jgi:hypothetical protein
MYLEERTKRKNQMDKEQRFYHEGVFYESQEEFFKAANQWANSPISPISLERMWHQMGKTFSMNIFCVLPYLHKDLIVNAHFSEILENALDFIMDKVNEKVKQIHEKEGQE